MKRKLKVRQYRPHLPDGCLTGTGLAWPGLAWPGLAWPGLAFEA
ncbi:hypothetical protein [Streptomyces sp. NPDC048710]